MRKLYLIILLAIFTCLPLSGNLRFVSAGLDTHTGYLFRGFSPGGGRPALSISASAGFDRFPLQMTQWYTHTAGGSDIYRESGTLLDTYTAVTNNIYISGGTILYFYYGVHSMPPVSLECFFMLSHLNRILPLYLENYYDAVLGSIYSRLNASYGIETVIPLQISLSAGINYRDYERLGRSIPAGFSDISLSLSSYFSLSHVSITPKLILSMPGSEEINSRSVRTNFFLNVTYNN